jgi:hypothetical protein
MKRYPNKKLIEETKRIIHWRLFLNECGLKRYYISAKNILRLSKAVV